MQDSPIPIVWTAYCQKSTGALWSKGCNPVHDAGAHPWLEVGRTSGDSGGLVGLSDGQVFGLLPLRSLVLWATLPLNEPNKPWTALTPALVSTPEEARVAACTGMRLVLQEVAPSQRHAEVLVASDCSVSFRALRLTPNPPPNQTRCAHAGNLAAVLYGRRRDLEGGTCLPCENMRCRVRTEEWKRAMHGRSQLGS